MAQSGRNGEKRPYCARFRGPGVTVTAEGGQPPASVNLRVERDHAGAPCLAQRCDEVLSLQGGDHAIHLSDELTRFDVILLEHDLANFFETVARAE